ncbi:uncharacterized protein LOC112156055 isoform X2 [Oryzias melastigma]|uniref:uncharacterized protein LOC112156055 isoform X2 n=1 Tax=Oryzias melastigma TaxID=30732 RepID=UPI000CF7F27C|nr:uncharacterized protein LOC112156055 isoform X2 [Oryzias melastigma]
MDAFRKLQSETPQEQREPQLRFTAEAAVALLQSFGLDKDDLEELLLYPEEQMSPAMLAQILWKIRAEKDQRAQSEANPESSGSPSGAAFKSCEDFTGRRSGLNDKGSSVKAQCSSVKTPKPLGKSKQLRSSKTSVEKPKLKAKQSLKSKVCKSAPLKKKKRTTDLKTVQTDGKNKIKSSVKRIAAAKPAKTTKKLDQKDQEKCPSVSGLTKPTVVHAGPSHSSRQFPTEVPQSLPTIAMIQDYAAETPRVFPHSCCLCGKNSEDMMDWFFHQTSSLHLLNCKQLRTRFPEWDGEVRSILREPSHSRQSRASTRSQDKRRCRRRSWDGRSKSPSWSPPHPRVSSSSRSRSPHANRGGKAQPDRRGRRSPGLHRRRDSTERREGSWSPAGSPRHKSSSADRGTSSRRGDEALPPPPALKRSCGRRSSTETPLSSAEKVAKKMLKKSAVQVLSKQSDVQTAVRTLAPVLLAELAKVTSTPFPTEAETLELAKRVAKKLSKEKPVLKKPKKVTAGSAKVGENSQHQKNAPKTPSKKLLSKTSVEKKKALKKKVAVKVKAVGAKQTRTKNPEGTQKIQKKPEEPVTEPTTSSCCASDTATPTNKASTSSAAVTSLTVGERLGENLTAKHFYCYDISRLMKKDSSKETKRLLKIKQMLISNLPKYHDGCYTQEELAEVLRPFGFELGKNNIYVVPQAQIAVVQMAYSAGLQRAVAASADGVFFKESWLCFKALSARINMQPIGFYKSLMKRMSLVTDDGSSTIFVQNISPREVGELRDALMKIGSVKNFMPLLSKVFIEFESAQDADRLGVWFGLLKRRFGCEVCRLKTPTSSSTALPPRLPAKALPNSRDIVNGVFVLTTKRDIPEGSTSPFWVPMTTSPYLFPTASAWFIIPSYVTVKETADIKNAAPKSSKFSTVMLTGLPEGKYMFTDITKRVSPYFPKDNDCFFSSKVVVLPLQRRAFIFFNSWIMCSTFAEDCIKSPFLVRDYQLNIHFVLENLHPHSSEEVMYRNLMKLSNGYFPQPACLEERLLLVEIFQTSVFLIKMVMNAVASIAPFVSFLPLANTIYIEMAEPRGVVDVVNSSSLRSQFTSEVWAKIRFIRPISVKVLRENLEDSNDLPTSNCEQDTGTHSTCEPPQTGSAVDSEPTSSAAATEGLENISSDSASDSYSPLRPAADPQIQPDHTDQVEPVEMDASDLHSSHEESQSPGPEGGESRDQIPVETREIHVDPDDGGTKTEEDDQKPEPVTKKISECEAGTVQEEEDAHQEPDLSDDQPTAAETQSVEYGHVTVETLPVEDPLKTSEKVEGFQIEEDTEGLKEDVPTGFGSDKREEEVHDDKQSPVEAAENVPDEVAPEEPTENPAEELTNKEFHHVKVQRPDPADHHVENVSEDPSRSERAAPEEESHAAGDQPAAEVKEEPPTLEVKEEPQRFEVDSAAGEDGKGDKDDHKNTSGSTKRKLGDDTEEPLKPDDPQEPAVVTRPRGRPRKKIRAAGVRRSPRGKAEAPGDQVKEEEEIQERAEDAGSLPLEVKKEDETVTAFRKQTRMFLPLAENQTPPQSVRVSPRSKLKPFNPNCSYGLEFTVRTKAFYCNLCSVFYMRESVEEDLHCCSKLHYDKLREYYQKRAQLRKCSRKLT